jgi:hypothetical protein
VLDLRFVSPEVTKFYGTKGNVSEDPVVIMKMLLLFLDSVRSERELMRIIPETAQQWYCICCQHRLPHDKRCRRCDHEAREAAEVISQNQIDGQHDKIEADQSSEGKTDSSPAALSISPRNNEFRSRADLKGFVGGGMQNGEKGVMRLFLGSSARLIHAFPFTGSVNRKHAPPPGLFSARICPP